MARKLKKEDVDRYRDALAHLRNVIVGDIGDLEADAFSANAERPSVDNPADIGTDSHAQEFSLELLQRDEKTLGEIQAAIERVEAGTYGRCESCDAWIPKTRLNAVPHARNCVDCQREAERAS